MTIRSAALAAIVSAALPATAQAASAFADFSAFFDVEIIAPDATVSIFDEDFFVDEVSGGTGFASGGFDPDPFSSFGVAEAFDPFGFGSVFSSAFRDVDVTNETDDDITATVEWSLFAEAAAEVIPGSGFADAFAEAFAGIDVASDYGELGFFEEIEAFASGEFGLDDELDFLSGSSSFVIPAGGTLFVDAFVEGDAFAVVIPLPASLAFGLTGLAGLGLLRARRAT